MKRGKPRGSVPRLTLVLDPRYASGLFLAFTLADVADVFELVRDRIARKSKKP